MPVPPFLRDCPGFLAFVLRRWREDRCPEVAGSLAFATLLVLVPLFTVVVALLSSLPFFGAVKEQIKTFLLQKFVPDIAERIITVYMAQFAEAAGRLTALSLVALFAITIATMFMVDRSLNRIWRSHRRRPLWLSVAAYIVLLAAGPILIAASLSATTWLAAASLDRVTLTSRAESIVLGAAPVTVIAFALFLAYRGFPNRHVPAAHALAGGVLAAVVFELTKAAFAAWIRHVPTYRLVYGAFAAIPIFLLWLYLVWAVVLFGAEFTAALTYWRQRLWRRRDSPARRLRGALDIVRFLEDTRDSPATLRRLREAVALPGHQIEDVLHRLGDAGIAARLRGGWVLARPLSGVSLGEIHHVAQPEPVTLSAEDWARCSAQLGRLAADMQVALRIPVADLPRDAGPEEAA